MASREEAVPKTMVLVVFLYLVVPAVAGASNNYVVGGDTGWIIPTDGSINYTAWASNITFLVGDTLAFHYVANHTVVQTNDPKTFDSCDATANDDSLQIWSSLNSTGATVELTGAGDTYFFCSAFDGEHCRLGQKFKIHVDPVAGAALPPSVAASPESGGDGDDSPDFDSTAAPPPPPPPELNPAPSSSPSLGRLWIIVLGLPLALFLSNDY